MQTISITRLRGFVAQAQGAHAAMMAANERYREANTALTRAKDALRAYDDSAHARNAARKAHDSNYDHRARYVQDVRNAEEALTAAEAAQAAASEDWDAASSLANRGREHARSHGVLPPDMEKN